MIAASSIAAAGGVAQASMALRIYDERTAGWEALYALRAILEALDEAGVEVAVASGLDGRISLARAVLECEATKDTPRVVKLEHAAVEYQAARDRELAWARRERERTPTTPQAADERQRWMRSALEGARRQQHCLVVILKALRQERARIRLALPIGPATADEPLVDATPEVAP
jgi:hypothetical protein